jgi:hypothetical protein
MRRRAREAKSENSKLDCNESEHSKLFWVENACMHARYSIHFMPLSRFLSLISLYVCMYVCVLRPSNHTNNVEFCVVRWKTPLLKLRIFSPVSSIYYIILALLLESMPTRISIDRA